MAIDFTEARADAQYPLGRNFDIEGNDLPAVNSGLAHRSRLINQVTALNAPEA